MNRTRRHLTRAALAVTAMLALAACGNSSDPLATDDASARVQAEGNEVVVGSANFPESQLLAEIYAGALRAKGVNASTKPGIGSREVYLGALQDGSIDAIAEYTGNLAQYFDHQADISDPEQALASAKAVLPNSLRLLTPASAEDKNTLVVTQSTADAHKLATIADLAPVASKFQIGGPPEFAQRIDGIPGLQRVYGLTFKGFTSLAAGGPLTVQALKNGQVQVANLFSTDPNIPANGFVTLADPEQVFGSQQVVPLLTQAAATPTVTQALDGVSAKLDTKTLTDLVGQVVLDNKDADAVAAAWLAQTGLN